MSTPTVQLFFALLTLVAFAFVAGLTILRLAAAASPSATRTWDGVAATIEANALTMAFVVASLATAGSLYFSEIAHFEPCRLCWYQRIAMYPLVVILGIAAVRRDRAVRVYGIALAAIGAVVSTYHVALEWIPALDTGSCGVGPSCGVVWFRELGFVSLPTMALGAFLLIIAVLATRPGRTE